MIHNVKGCTWILSFLFWVFFFFFSRQVGQDTAEELRSKDFRKDLEEREWQAARERGKEKGSRSSIEQPKRPRLDQPPPSNLDADDPVDDEDEDDSDERCNISDHMYGMKTSLLALNQILTRTSCLARQACVFPTNQSHFYQIW